MINKRLKCSTTTPIYIYGDKLINMEVVEYIYIYIYKRLKWFVKQHQVESMRKSNILSWLLFVLISSSRIRTYSLLYWPKIYIPHCGGPFVAIQAFTKLLFSFSDVLKTTNCTFQEVDNIFCLAVGIAVYDEFFYFHSFM
jgi:hypothetical protein